MATLAPLNSAELDQLDVSRAELSGFQLHLDPGKRGFRAVPRLDPISHHVILERAQLHHAAHASGKCMQQRGATICFSSSRCSRLSSWGFGNMPSTTRRVEIVFGDECRHLAVRACQRHAGLPGSVRHQRARLPVWRACASARRSGAHPGSRQSSHYMRQ